MNLFAFCGTQAGPDSDAGPDFLERRVDSGNVAAVNSESMRAGGGEG